jgi:hypothetical protein
MKPWLTRIAWIALFATLFSAASPVFAAFIYAEDAAVLAQMLGVPTAEPPPAGEECADHLGHHDAQPSPESGTSDGSPHAAHGIYCSFCLNPSSVATIALAPVAFPVLTVAFHVGVTATPIERRFAFVALYQSRAPPNHS